MIYVGDADTFSYKKTTPGDSVKSYSSTLSLKSSFGVENGIFLRIINRDYRLILSENNRMASNNRIDMLQEAIKLSYFYHNRNDNNIASHTNNERSETKIIDRREEKNGTKVSVNKKVKPKTYAKIPIQFHEFQNVSF